MPAPLSVHSDDADALANEGPLPNPFQHDLLARMSQGTFERIDPGVARVDFRLDDNDVVPGTRAIRVVHVPGHTPGSIALHLPHRRAVVVGDALQYRFGRMMPPSRLFTQDMAQAYESIRKLAAVDAETVCFSHFRPILDGGSAELRAFAESL
jgi:glyoxylase-like metal-dependent hydrolase (beta-lactamase superfamily II)